MASVPDAIDLPRHGELRGRQRGIWARRIALAAVLVFVVLGLLNVFGQRPSTSRAASAAAVLTVSAPTRIRGGLLYQARFDLTARRDLKDARLVLDSGWLNGVQFNSFNPSALNEGSRNGKLTLELGHIPAGHVASYFMQFQVDPTVIGRRSQNVELDDGSKPLLTIHRSVTAFP